MYFLVMKTKN